MNRDQAITLMLRLEGGETNLAGDPGGHTKYGITQRTLDRLHTLVAQLPTGVSDLTAAQATLIYQTVHWADIHGDELPAPLACLMLNAAINMGLCGAVRLLQGCVDLHVDGIMGPLTLRSVAAWRSPYQSDQTLAQEFCAHMAASYAALDGREAQFELGWFRRLFLVYTLAVFS